MGKVTPISTEGKHVSTNMTQTTTKLDLLLWLVEHPSVGSCTKLRPSELYKMQRKRMVMSNGKQVNLGLSLTSTHPSAKTGSIDVVSGVENAHFVTFPLF